MNKKLLKYIVYIFILIILYYIIPKIFSKNDGSAEFFILLILTPIAILLLSIFYGIKYGLDLLIPIITVMMFIVAVFTIYNSSALIYLVIYGVIALVGNFLGSLFYKIRK